MTPTDPAGPTGEPRKPGRSIPLGLIRLGIQVSRNPDFRWRRVTLRRVMILVAAMAFATWYWVLELKQRSASSIAIVYPVADLVGRADLGPRFGDLNGVAGAVLKDVPGDRWSPRPRSITPFFLSRSLIVRNSPSGHELVARHLKALRTRPPKTGPPGDGAR